MEILAWMGGARSRNWSCGWPPSPEHGKFCAWRTSWDLVNRMLVTPGAEITGYIWIGGGRNGWAW